MDFKGWLYLREMEAAAGDGGGTTTGDVAHYVGGICPDCQKKKKKCKKCKK